MSAEKQQQPWVKEVPELIVEIELDVVREGKTPLVVYKMKNGAQIQQHVELLSRGSSGDSVEEIEIKGRKIKVGIRKIKNEEDRRRINYYKEVLDVAEYLKKGKMPSTLWRANVLQSVILKHNQSSLKITAMAALSLLQQQESNGYFIFDSDLDSSMAEFEVGLDYGLIKAKLTSITDEIDFEQAQKQLEEEERELEEKKIELEFSTQNPEEYALVVEYNEILRKICSEFINIKTALRVIKNNTNYKPETSNQVWLACIEWVSEPAGKLDTIVSIKEYLEGSRLTKYKMEEIKRRFNTLA
jgi:hypothetical protein